MVVPSTAKTLVRRVVPSWVWTKLRLARIRANIARYKVRRVRHTYGGFSLDIVLADPLAEGWYDHDWVHTPELDLLRRHRLREGATVFDLGAHQGIVALMLSRIVGPAGRVIALEPNSHNAEIARRNRDFNGASNIEIIQAAAASQSGTLMFNLGLNGNVDDGSGDWGRSQVRCLSVDDLAERYGVPDVLFVDVEGFEQQVLKGASSTLSSNPDCFVEVHTGCGLEKYGGSVCAVLSFFPRERFRLLVNAREKDQFRALEELSVILTERFFLIATGQPSGVSAAISLDR